MEMYNEENSAAKFVNNLALSTLVIPNTFLSTVLTILQVLKKISNKQKNPYAPAEI